MANGQGPEFRVVIGVDNPDGQGRFYHTVGRAFRSKRGSGLNIVLNPATVLDARDFMPGTPMSLHIYRNDDNEQRSGGGHRAGPPPGDDLPF